MKLCIGTRGSALALWQTEHVISRLADVAPGLDVRVDKIKTQGDLVRDRALWQVEGRGFFVKEIENALLSGQIDLAVHSLKDVPTELPDGLTLGAILERADPHDALLAREGLTELDSLPHGALVGTSSLRRRAQLLAARPDLQISDLRGNVDTRLRKLRDGEYDAIILAVAGLERLGLERHITQRLPADMLLPAPAQGALALQCRTGDAAVLELLRPLHHYPSAQAVRAERAFLNGLSSGCSAPVAAYAQVSQGALQLRGLVASLDGSRVVRVSDEGAPDEPELLGQRLAQQALEQGASAILESIL
jgi:hydroxymethylbilane synthase